MLIFNHEVGKEYALQGKNARTLVETCSEFNSHITIECGKKKTEARNILGIIRLNAKKGDKLNIIINGRDEELAYAILYSYFGENL